MAALAVALLIGLAATVGVLYGRIPVAAAPVPAPPALAVPPPVPVEPVTGRFTEPPYACGLLTRSQFAELVPTPFSRRNGRGGCEWDSSDAKPRRYSLSIMVEFLPTEARAREFFAAQRVDATAPRAVAGLGEEAYKTGGLTSTPFSGFTRSTVVRLGNLIAKIDYMAEGVRTDRDGRLERGSRRAAEWAVRALNRLG
ncbi:hypothetical protein [Streptosporangium sp. CA-115845]|uniref:hypothetical protein n=1 Tax=Streptosporangium sp. CA-115845 TaxID=3240071 RepID=UPI003D94D1BB